MAGGLIRMATTIRLAILTTTWRGVALQKISKIW